MVVDELFLKCAYKASEIVTKQYSTSFSLSTFFLPKEQRKSIYAIYGFVRLADEIVDTFNNFDKHTLFNQFINEFYYSLEHGISSNILLVSFVDTVRKYKIPVEYINAFLESMQKDLSKKDYESTKETDDYIYGSANVVGLMCLCVFLNGDQEKFKELEDSAQHLGAAFQKVNFLRDLENDTNNLGRKYFPEILNGQFDIQSKKQIEQSVENDFLLAVEGIRKLPGRSKLAVSMAYYFYKTLFKKIKKLPPEHIINQRVRISNFRKALILIKVILLNFLKLI